MPESTYSICGNCAYFFSLSTKDKQLMEGPFSQSFLQAFLVRGVCIRRQEDSGVLVDRILFDQYPLKKCDYKKIGDRIFQTPYSCPKCTENIYIKNDSGYKAFYCVKCKKSFKYLQIVTNCRTCSKPLLLEAGVVFVCKCKTCGKGIEIPIIPQVYPSLLPTNKLCVHGKKINDCSLCFACLKNRSNILFHEIHVAITNQREKSKEKRLDYENYIRNHKSGRIINIDDESLELDEADQELISKYSKSRNRNLDWSDGFDDIEDWSDKTDVDDDFYY